MANIYIENRDRWEQLSEVDYLSAFTNAWLAFNAWYRNAYQEHQDRKIINSFKNQPNVIRNKIIPLLTNQSEEGEQLRAIVGNLHNRIENYQIHSGKSTDKVRISLTNVYLRDSVATSQIVQHSGFTYQVIPGGNQIETKVINRNNIDVFRHIQTKYDLGGIETQTDFVSKLNPSQQGRLKALYRLINPRFEANLLSMGQSDIVCGAHCFKSTPEDLFAGIVEIIYLMRCTLFHGELVPSREAANCYEPAYHLVRKFLQSIS